MGDQRIISLGGCQGTGEPAHGAQTHPPSGDMGGHYVLTLCSLLLIILVVLSRILIP